MRTLGRKSIVTVLVVLMTTGVAWVAPAQASAPSLMSEAKVKKALLTLPEVRKLSGVPDLAADETTCHHAPYYKGFVNYCYYTFLNSKARFSAGQLWPNHVDIIAFDSKAAAVRYIRELKRDRKTSKLLSSTADSAVFYDLDAPIGIPAIGAAEATSVLGPTVSGFYRDGTEVVYTACADPKATTPTAMQACATKNAKAQLAKLKANR